MVWGGGGKRRLQNEPNSLAFLKRDARKTPKEPPKDLDVHYFHDIMYSRCFTNAAWEREATVDDGRRPDSEHSSANEHNAEHLEGAH